ncbi:hypothetical protein PLICRDRAFT_673346 [Plicaturopsis crispa FD-325 SS-3]|nr:hypothetical protein PLICRDRAFT_673346 [Plicaturopsis crispa FD-325 SS-3]
MAFLAFVALVVSAFSLFQDGLAMPSGSMKRNAQADYLDAHNSFRAKHGASALT